MGIFNPRSWKLFQPKRSDFTRPQGAPVIPVGQLPVYPALNLSTYVSAYNNNATVYTIVNLMARKFATLPRYLTEVSDESSQKRYKHLLRTNPGASHKRLKELYKRAYNQQLPSIAAQSAITKLIENPNEYMGQDTFYATIYTYKKTTGNAYVWLNRGDIDGITGPDRLKMPVLEMWVLPSQFITIAVDRDYLFGEIVGYVLYDQGVPIHFAPEDIIHWRDPNPRYDSYNFTHFYGVSPLEPGMPLITQDKAGRDAMVAMYQHGGARGVLARTDPDAQRETPEQAASRRSAIDTKINNRAEKSSVVSLIGDWKYLQMGDSAVDMEFVQTMDKVFQRICNLLGCNPQLFETQTTFNNVEQARKDLITNAILPDACSYRDEENRVLLQAFGLDDSKYCIDIDPTDISELQDNMKDLTATIMSNWTLTPNERREELGFDESDDPALDEHYFPNNLILAEDAAVPTSGLGDDGSSDTEDSGGKISPSNGVGMLANEVADKWHAYSLQPGN